MKSKKAVTNLTMVIGILLCSGLIFAGSFMVFESYLDNKIKADPRYTARELAQIINLMQSIPESGVFEYYTDVDQYGFPVIGSLEIDAEKRKLCTSPHSEKRMYIEISNAAKGGLAEAAAIPVLNAMRGAGGDPLIRSASEVNDLNFRAGGASLVGPKGDLASLSVRQKDAASLIFRNDELGDAVRNLGTKGTRIDFTKQGVKEVFRNSGGYNGHKITGELGDVIADKKQWAKVWSKHGLKGSADVAEEARQEIWKIRRTKLWKIARIGGGETGKWRRDALARGLGTNLGAEYMNDFNKAAKQKGMFRNYIKGLKSSGTLAHYKNKILRKMPFTVKTSSMYAYEARTAGNLGTKVSYRARALNYIQEKTHWTSIKNSIKNKVRGVATKTIFRGDKGSKLLAKIDASIAWKRTSKFSFTKVAGWSVLAIYMNGLESVYGKYLLGRVITQTIVSLVIRKVPVIANSAAIQNAEAQQGQNPNPITWTGAFIKHGGAAIFNLIESVWTLWMIDYTILRVREEGQSAADKERALVTCIEFESEKPKLYPPNCVPYLAYGPEKERGGPGETGLTEQAIQVGKDYDKMQERGGALAEASLGLINAASKIFSDPLNAFKDMILEFGKFILALADFILFVLSELIQMMYTLIDFFTHISEKLDYIIPHSDCYTTEPGTSLADSVEDWDFPLGSESTGCDMQGIGQDCPNYFISDPGGFRNTVQGGLFIGFIQAGPICNVLSALGTSGNVCYVIMFAGVGSAFAYNPGGIKNVMLGADTVGLNKQSVGAQDITGGSCDWETEICYADNSGYWYAEFPGSIQFSRMRDPEKGTSRLIISKGG